MISIAGADNLHKIVVLNPKGGCGKTTLATNLASFYALRGPPPTLVDCDPQGFCLRWLDKRSPQRPAIHGIDGHSEAPDAGLWELAIPPDSSAVIIDLPAAIPHQRLHHYTYLADSVLLPVMPSPIDIFAATRFIAELLLDVQLDRREQKLAIVANRVRSRTKSYRMLMRFLSSLKIPVLATLRDRRLRDGSLQGGERCCGDLFDCRLAGRARRHACAAPGNDREHCLPARRAPRICGRRSRRGLAGGGTRSR